MKKILTTLVLLASIANSLTQTAAYDIRFTWTPNPPQELVSGYRIEYQKLPVVTNWTYITFAPATTNSATIRALQPGYTYKFRAFAVNSIGIGTNLSSIVQIPTSTPTVVSNFSKISP